MIENPNVEVSVSEEDGRKITKIDIGNFSQEEKDQYLCEVMARYKNKLK